MHIQGCGLKCEVFLLQLLCRVHLCHIQNFHTSDDFFGFELFIIWLCLLLE